MNKKLLKVLAITACSLTFATTLSVGVSSLDNFQTAKAYEITFENADALAETYAQGSTMTIPMGSIEGVKASRYIITSPSGYSYDSETLTLSEAGNYTIKWYATVGGKEVFAEKKFLVNKSIFTLEGNASCEYMEDLEVAEFANYETGSFTRDEVTTEGDGIKVTVGENSTFTYNNVIDLRNFSTNPFIEIYPHQQLVNLWTAISGSYCEFNEDAMNYLITLTDCYDSSKYVTIDLEYLPVWIMHSYNAYFMNYRAGANGQVLHGLTQAEEKGAIRIEGKQYKVGFAPSRGAEGSNASQLGMKLYYDTQTQRIYVDFAEVLCSKNTGLWLKRVLLADLANKEIYPDNAFEGFTTGEVYLSLSAKNIINKTANMDITSIGGLTGQDILKVDPDTEDPAITIDEKLSTMKKIALNEEITIPDARAFDPGMLYGNVAKKAVYYNYDPNSATNTLVGIVNGKFTPKKTGTYTIVYTATDISNNSSTLTVDLECVEATGGKAVNLTATSVEVEAGAYENIPECTVSGLYTDESLLKLYYTDSNGKQKLYTDDKIFLDRLGNFEFTYVYETPFATYTQTAVINALETDRVVMGTPILPEYLIKGAKYTLDNVFAQEYTAVPTDPVASTMYMKADNGEYVEVNPKAVEIPAASTVQFKYVYGTGEVESAPVKVIDVGFGGTLSAIEYFHDENNAFTKTATKNSLQFVTKGSPKEATLTYINPLALSTFDIEFTFLSKNKEGTATYVAPTDVTFTFTDYYDRSKVATFKMRPAKAGLYIDINGVSKVGQIIGRKFIDLKTYFNYKDGVIKFEGVDYDLGDVITSDRVLFSITMEGVNKGEACMDVSLLCDNMLTSAKFDTTTPKLSVEKTNMGYHSFGKVITIGKAVASDLICPYLESGLKLVVRMPDGSFAKSEDGITLDGTNPVDREYQVKLNQVGLYSVLYTYTDQNDGYESFSYSPLVKDEQGPTIVVEGRVEDEVVTAKWGASVTVASYSVSDDISDAANVKSYVNVIYPSAIMRKVPNGGSFYAEEKGLYRVVYYAMDEVGNISLFTYYVQVS